MNDEYIPGSYLDPVSDAEAWMAAEEAKAAAKEAMVKMYKDALWYDCLNYDKAKELVYQWEAGEESLTAIFEAAAEWKRCLELGHHSENDCYRVMGQAIFKLLDTELEDIAKEQVEAKR